MLVWRQKEYGVIPYVDDITDFTQFKDQIHVLFSKIEKNPERSDSPIFNYLTESDLILSDYNRNRTISQLHSLLSEIGENLAIIHLIESDYKRKGVLNFFQFVYNSLEYSLSTYNVPDMYDFYLEAQIIRVALRTSNYRLNTFRIARKLPDPLTMETKKLKKDLSRFRKSILKLENAVSRNEVKFEPPHINLIDPSVSNEFKKEIKKIMK